MKRKVAYEYVSFQEQTSFRCASYQVPVTDVMPLHQHPEWEITLIQKGSGTVVTGDALDTFAPGTVTIVPPMVPHCWVFAPVSKDGSNLTANTTLHFENSLLEKLAGFKELERVCNSLRHMSAAITWNGDIAADIGEQILSVSGQQGAERLFSFAKIIESCVSKTDEAHVAVRQLAADATEEEDRIRKVIKYITENYMHRITLEDVADMACMSKTRFCVYFRQCFRQTFFTFLNQYRIEMAISRLLESRSSVADVCFEVGFNDVPHFIRTFKKYKGCAPKAYLAKIKPANRP